MNGVWEFFDAAIGLQTGEAPPTVLQTTVRALLMYLTGYILLRRTEFPQAESSGTKKLETWNMELET